jgi:hypothetical protein
MCLKYRKKRYLCIICKFPGSLCNLTASLVKMKVVVANCHVWEALKAAKFVWLLASIMVLRTLLLCKWRVNSGSGIGDQFFIDHWMGMSSFRNFGYGHVSWPWIMLEDVTQLWIGPLELEYRTYHVPNSIS